MIYILYIYMCSQLLIGNKRQRTTSDHSDEDIPSSKHESTDKHISLDNDTRCISSRRGKKPTSRRS